MESINTYQDRLAKLLTIGLLSGIIAAGVNVCYMLLYESLTGYSIEKYINVMSVSISSIVPSVFVGLLYFSLRRSMNWSKAYSYFLALIAIASLISFIGPLSNELPDGSPLPSEFIGLTLPMHIFAPLVYVLMIVRTVPRVKK